MRSLNTSKIMIKEYKYKLPGWLFVSLALLVGACMPPGLSEPADLSGGQDSQQPEPLETQLPDTPQISRETRPAPRLPERVPADPDALASPVMGETPGELLEVIKSDLASRTGASSGEIIVLRDQAMVFNDGSLGCPQPGMFYTQATVAGYWVVLELGQVEYDYRATKNGFFILCEGGSLPSIQPPGSEPSTR
jgi:hypothetical protein